MNIQGTRWTRGLAAAASLWLIAAALPQATAAQTPLPFACTGEGFIVQNINAQLSQVDQTSSPFAFVPIGGPAGIEINNLGFRQNDGFLYGVQLTPSGNAQIVQIDSSGTVFGLGIPTGLPTSIRFDGGDISSDGSTMYIKAANRPLYILDLGTFTATQQNVTGASGFVFDWAYNPVDGLLYGGDSTQGQLAVLNPATGIRNDIAVAGLPSGTAYGGAWFNASGSLFLYRNNGEIFELELTGPSIIDQQSGPGSTRNDGAACVQSSVGLAKQMTLTSMDGLPDTISIDLVFENISATDDVTDLDAEDDLSAVFGNHGVDWTFTSISSVPAGFANLSYDGHTNVQLINQPQSLLAAGSAMITIEIELHTLAQINPQNEFCNQTTVFGLTEEGVLVGDLSTDGLDPDPDGDGGVEENTPSCLAYQSAAIQLIKDGALNVGGNGLPDPGDLIDYTFDVTNTGSVPLTDVVVSDPLISPILCPSGNPIPTLAVGASETCTGSYALTQQNIDDGSVYNTANATGDDPAGNPVSDDDDHLEPVENISITLVKDGTLDLGANGLADVGDLIDYTFLVTNTGNQTLTSVTVTDPIVSPIACPTTTLAPGASQTCTGSYALTQADLDLGYRDNTATAEGTGPGGGMVSDDDTHIEPLPQQCVPLQLDFETDAAGNVLATGQIIDDEFASLGIHITTFDPVNHPAMIFDSANPTGNDPDLGTPNQDFGGPGVGNGGESGMPGENAVPLGQVLIISTDGDSADPDDHGSGGEIIFTFDEPLRVDNADVLDQERVTHIRAYSDVAGNTLLLDAAGQSYGNNSFQTIDLLDTEGVQRLVVDFPESGAVTNVGLCVTPPQIPGIRLVKTGQLDLGTNGLADPGDLIHYQFQITNAGQVELTSVTLSDTIVNSFTCPGGHPIASMLPSAQVTCTGTYAITQGDIDAGQRDNFAMVTGTDPDGGQVTDDDDHVEPIGWVASISLVKDGALDVGVDGITSPGDFIDYTFVITNTGNVVLTNVELDDSIVGMFFCPEIHPIADMVPGESIICTGSYAITDTDMELGERYNVADVTGYDPNGDPVVDQDDHLEPLVVIIINGFECTSDAFIVQDINAMLSTVDPAGGGFTFNPIANFNVEINNLGFRRTDGNLYGVQLSPSGNVQIVQIDENGVLTGLGRPAGLPTGPRFDAGDVSPDGDTMYINAVNQRLYKVDLTSLPSLPAVTSVAVSGASGFVFDWAADPVTGMLYGGDSTGNASGGQLAMLDPNTGVRIDLNVPGLPRSVAFGGAWFDQTGLLYLYRNSGTIYQIDLSGPTILSTGNGPTSSRNDGAGCVRNDP